MGQTRKQLTKSGLARIRLIRHLTAVIGLITAFCLPAAANVSDSETPAQDSGMVWPIQHQDDLPVWGAWLLLGTLGALVLFFLIRGRIRLRGPITGLTIERFAYAERFAHWLTAGSFVILGITGLLTLFGHSFLIPWLGHAAYPPIANACKWIHGSVSWAFMLGLVLIFVMWVVQSIPGKTDLIWLVRGGGLFSRNSRVHARKFNAGQKIIFWSVILLGICISLTGLSLMFPFKLQIFSHGSAFLNWTGLPEQFLSDPLLADMTPQHEIQLARTWHMIIAFVFIAIILCHIYIGTIGMQGAISAMGSGNVDAQWARQHHDLWYEDVTGRNADEHIRPATDTAARRS